MKRLIKALIFIFFKFFIAVTFLLSLFELEDRLDRPGDPFRGVGTKPIVNPFPFPFDFPGLGLMGPRLVGLGPVGLRPAELGPVGLRPAELGPAGLGPVALLRDCGEDFFVFSQSLRELSGVEVSVAFRVGIMW